MATVQDFKHPARFCALKVLYQVETTGAFVDHVLEQLWQTASIEDDRDRRLITMLVNGVLRWRKRIDWLLEQFVRGGVKRLDPWTHNALRMGVFQLLFLNRIPTWAAIDESVELAKRMSGRGAAGLVNAVLRRVARDHDTVEYPSLDEDPVAHIAVMHSHPEWMVRRWLKRYGLRDTIALCEFNNTPRPLILRVNRLRTTVPAVRRRLDTAGIPHQVGRYHPYSLEIHASIAVGELSIHQEGLVQVQDEAASLVGLLVDPQPGERIIDLCAAPGGKTTHMAELMANRGTILAVDLHAHRRDQLIANCRRLGITCVQPLVADARAPLDVPPADRVLVDAPCSGLGVLARRADARWHKSEADIAQLQALQQEILEAAVQLVRPGGRLVYSTCTLEPEENEEVVRWLLQRFSPAFEQVPVSGDVIPPALIDADGFYRALPHRHGIDGAFGAILQRHAG